MSRFSTPFEIGMLREIAIIEHFACVGIASRPSDARGDWGLLGTVPFISDSRSERTSAQQFSLIVLAALACCRKMF
jgi:hypothetical protein